MRKCEEQISDRQFGFINAVGTKKTLFGDFFYVNCDVICLSFLKMPTWRTKTSE